MIYLDNSATTRQYDEVTDFMAMVARESFGNPSSLHKAGLDSEKIVKNARNQVAKALGCKADEIYFTSCGTESDNTVLMAQALKRNAGKRIITTKVEHPAILEPCKRLEEMGYEVIYLDVDRDCNINLDELRNAINDDTILISVMTVNNEVGTAMPIPEIAKIKDEYNREHKTRILLHTDAVQAVGKVEINLKGNLKGVDFLSASAHKFHGPKGMGILYVNKDGYGANIKPFLVGGGQEKGFRSGTENVPGIAGTGLAIEMVTKDLENRICYLYNLRDRLIDGLKSNIDRIEIHPSLDDNVSVCPAVLNVSFLGTRGEVILHTLEQDGIYVSTGSACSSNHKSSKGSHVLNAMGLKPDEIEGAIRFSFSELNTPEDIDNTIDAVVKAVTKFRKLGSFR